jgi:multiple sugar transport system ATP-binding protein
VAFLELTDVSKDFGTLNVIKSISLTAERGEFLILVGPSGCGKTTLLRMIAGLEATTSGRISIEGRDVTELDAGERDLAMVFQNYALFPHMTVRNNISFGMRMGGVPKSEIDARVTEAARFLQITELLSRKPAQLSGGQRQRVAMGRAIVRRPNAFLMDEPLSNLDANLRVQMRGEVLRIQKELGVTTVYVTHDQIEAMTMADRVAVLHKGELQQIATPARLYDEPANLFVASFLGSPPMSFADAEVATDGDGRIGVSVGPQFIPLDDHHLDPFPDLAAMMGRKLVLGIRPENLCIDGAPERGTDFFSMTELPATVGLTEMLGAEEVVFAQVGATQHRAPQLSAFQNAAPLPGTDASAGPAVLVSRFGRRMASPARGDQVTLGLDRSRIHLFDWENGRSLRRKSSG